jgi:hypothetical protein
LGDFFGGAIKLLTNNNINGGVLPIITETFVILIRFPCIWHCDFLAPAGQLSDNSAPFLSA